MNEPVEPNGELRLHTDAWGRLVLIDADGVRHDGVEPLRAFPFSDPGRWIVIVDRAGRELLAVDDLATLNPESRAQLEAELRRREFVPIVTRVVRIKGEVPSAELSLETDRGPASVTVSDVDQVRRFGSGVLIVDTQGLRFRILNLEKLDAPSRRMLEPLV